MGWDDSEGAARGPSWGVTESPPPAALRSIHHVRVPVSDVEAAREWYSEVLGLEPVLDYEEEDRLVGVAMAAGSAVTLGLHLDPPRARAMAGFCVLALEVQDQGALGAWVDRLDGLGITHSGVREGHLGSYLEVADPDGVVVQLHTAEHPSADEA